MKTGNISSCISGSICKILVTSLLISFASLSMAVQPMSESDMDGVAFDSGQNLLNIYGSPEAGLRDDDLVDTKHQESKEALPVASLEVKSLEDNASKGGDGVEISNADPVAYNEAISASEEVLGTASAFTTDSEIRYKKQSVHHESTPIENGGVSVVRDLAIDQLKLENLRGDNYEQERSAGSIYISNWRSQGETRIINTQ